MRQAVCLFLMIMISVFAIGQTVSYDFESGNLDGWTQFPEGRWRATTQNVIDGNFSLQHYFPEASEPGDDRISKALPDWSGSEGTIVWRFKISYKRDVTSANRWAFYLYANHDASEFNYSESSTLNGYILGVNVEPSTSDKILKLYKVIDGNISVLLNTGINWAEEVGTGSTSLAAIEIVRSGAGLFTIRLSSNGEFSNLVTLGNVLDDEHSFGGHFGTYVKYSATQFDKLYLDNISISYTPQNTNDHDAQVLSPTTQIVGGEISSLATSPDQAVDVLSFDVNDQGTADGLPTYITKLRFAKVDSPNAASWPQAIGGVKLRGSSGEIPIQATYILDNAIELEIEKGDMVVGDNSTEEFTLSLYLSSNDVEDGKEIRLRVDDASHGWESHHEGSAFTDVFPEAVTSSAFAIVVIPTHLSIASYTQPLVVNVPFSVTAHAADINGNLAKSFNGADVVLSVLQGEGTLTPAESLTSTAIDGVITWNDISYSKKDILRLKVSANDLEDGVSEAIDVSNESTSVANLPADQVAGGSISSTISTIGKAVEVFRFGVSDLGAFDGAPTRVQQINITRPSGANMASFSGSIAGVVLKANGKVIPIGNPRILTASITIPLAENALVVPDGETLEVSMYIYLRTGSTVVDGNVLQFMIGKTSHDIVAYESGSTFAPEFDEDVVSSPFTIDVKATQLAFRNVPQAVGLNEPFAVEVAAVDDGGSLDANATGNVTLAKNSGDGWLQIPSVTVSMANGVAKWDGLKYSYTTPEPFNLIAKSATFNDVLSPLIYCADRTTRLTQPETPLEGGTISSLAVSKDDAVEVLRFGITDMGTTDNLPTRVAKMVFRSQEGDTDMSLNRTIGGVVLYADGKEIVPLSTTIESSAITLSFLSNGLVIPDGESVELSLKAFLKSGGQVDGSTLSLYIPASGHGWESVVTSSGFPSAWDMGLFGPTMEIDVEGNSLVFYEQPFITAGGESFALSIALADTYGNIDMDATGSATIDVDYGPGDIDVESESVTFVDGFAQWANVTLNAVGRYRLKVTSDQEGISQGVSQPIWNGAALVSHIDEDFETLPLSFELSPEWSVSTISPIEGKSSLKHGLTGVDGNSTLSIPLGIDNMGDGPLEWSFVMRNGDWDPSTSNTFWFVLSSDNQSIRQGSYNGYAVGVNLTGDDDLLTLWRVTQGKTAQVVVKADFDWDEAETVYVKVTRTPDGEWSLWYQPEFNQSSLRLAGKAVDATHTAAQYCGPAFIYTASRAGEFWLDNLVVSTATYPPTIQQARMLSLTSVDVVFSSAVDATDAELTTNYSITDEQGARYNVLGAFLNLDRPNRVTLRTEQLPLEELDLKIAGVKSALGTTTVNDSTIIGLGAAGTFGNVIINEIMARPSADGGLPNVEYVELYNRTDKSISLNGWKFRGNDSYANIPNATIEPNGYIILARTSGAPLMAEFGQSVGVTSFPTLLVGGMFVGIYDNNNHLISWVEYSDTWYKDDVKKAGGFSLERIDPNNLVEGQANWMASSDPSGGTPGRANSVVASNPDVVNPRVVEVQVISTTVFEVGFSEPMDSLSITLANKYSIDRDIGSPLWATASGPKYNRVRLTFETPIAPREIYNLCFDGSIIDFSGNGIETSCVQIALPEEPAANDIVINEVLFNPYAGGVDFVEIYNRSEKTFDLSKLWIANRNRTTLALNEFYRASATSRLLLPNSYAVLTENIEQVEQFYYIENPDAMVHTPRLPAYPNDNGYVLLLSDAGDEVDEFAYNEKMHNTLLADVKGVSLERINPNMPTNDQSSWQSAAQTAGFATPTAKNSQFTDPTQVNDEFELSLKVFSPDGDGFEDYVMINYELPENGYIANIMVFDSRGRRVKRLAANMTLGTSGSIKWDGTNDGGGRVTVGAYVIFIEAFDLRGNVKRYKKTVVVATRFR